MCERVAADLIAPVSKVTHDAGAARDDWSLLLLAGYAGLGVAASSWRLAAGDGSPVAIAVHAGLLALVVAVRRDGRESVHLVARWLPLFALPLLYWAIPWTIVHPGGRMFDAAVQQWDRELFGANLSRTLARAWPWAVVSATVHGAYLSYYAIIYGPPLLLSGTVGMPGRREAFQEVVRAFTVAMVTAFVIFLVFPVEGPRYAWPAPEGVPGDPLRRLALYLLERGSSRGTAFPSSHVAIATAIGLACWRASRGMGWVVLGATVLLAIGAVYGGFHYAIDVVAGGVVGAASWGLSRLPRPSMERKPVGRGGV